ncbi:hypothetical protein G7K_2102-t1 [Saitoella complicata NRRL Y-17804]|uniref:Uncharacterized protein n=1 Tax=Saitoella complicata (strain BCRC 22490 / CBS 7301 / JCM 7358 / NBRC 10748 / NRRL Y-17804) TaxID=698492 RepID=A0A0E9NDY0_SAICN|nr:hypothetical protein G7K_2102-t1 [Saitoella complicata NRRL Y-17804]
MAGCFTIFTAPAQALCSLFARKSTSAEAERERELNKTRINWTVEHPVSDASTNWGSRTSSAYSTGGSIPSRSSTADEITPLNAPAKPAKKAKRPKAKKEKLHEFFDQKTRKWVYLTESELEDEEEEPPLKYAQHWNNVHRMRMSSGEMKKAANGRVTAVMSNRYYSGYPALLETSMSHLQALKLTVDRTHDFYVHLQVQNFKKT